MGIGPHLVEGATVPPGPQVLEGAGEKVTVGVVFATAHKPPLAHQAPLQGPQWRLRQRPLHLHPRASRPLRQQGMRTVCILRDPRDVAVSQMYYIKQLKNHFAREEYMALP